MYHEQTKDLDAGDYLIQDLIERLEKVKRDCGARTIIKFDAGHNNISVEVIPSRARPKNIWGYPKGGGQLRSESE